MDGCISCMTHRRLNQRFLIRSAKACHLCLLDSVLMSLSNPSRLRISLTNVRAVLLVRVEVPSQMHTFVALLYISCIFDTCWFFSSSFSWSIHNASTHMKMS